MTQTSVLQQLRPGGEHAAPNPARPNQHFYAKHWMRQVQSQILTTASLQTKRHGCDGKINGYARCLRARFKSRIWLSIISAECISRHNIISHFDVRIFISMHCIVFRLAFAYYADCGINIGTIDFATPHKIFTFQNKYGHDGTKCSTLNFKCLISEDFYNTIDWCKKVIISSLEI